MNGKGGGSRAEPLESAGREGRRTLDEAESKALVSRYGVPTVEERVASTPEEAVEAGRELGFPVVLKALGAALAHKSEHGLVRIGLRGPSEVADAAREVARLGGGEVKGFVVQPLVPGRRELLLGLFRDPGFGPVVAFGLGGVLAEALDDVALALAPLTEAEAAALLERLRARAVLGRFRGEPAVQRDALIAAVLGLSRLAEEHPAVAEVDVNPLLVRPDGSVVAVDALVVLGDDRGREPRRRVSAGALARLFHPRSVAFVGATGKMGKWGHAVLTNCLAGGFPGPIYPVNPRGGSVAGREALPRVAALPDGVDLAVVTVPAETVASVVTQLGERGVRSAVVVSSGFGETGAEGRVLEERLVCAARDAGVTLVGPNTMGILNPHLRFYATGAHVRPQPGSAALLSQSGNMGVQLLSFAEAQGIGIRAFCGTGNEAMVGVEDFLEALETDDLTRTVILYLEGVKEGRRFFEAARRLGRRKPLVALKGGRTGAGQRAAASHTGALAGDARVFAAACRQAGVVLADHPTDLLDASAAFTALPLPRGPRVAVMTWGGGWGVVAADACAELGLELPALAPGVRERLDRLLPSYWSRTNPVDLVGEPGPALPAAVLEELLAWGGADAVIHLGILGRESFLRAGVASARAVDPEQPAAVLDAAEAQAARHEDESRRAIARLAERYGKPVVGVTLLPEPRGRTLLDVEGRADRILAFPTPERAARVLARLWEYRRFLLRGG
ncbi:MAG: acetate--CoA ligase family protein [Deferrisomatales bacterium]|nr:acetate--CoA ligase family protein [Deferrisomatales bacterium]